MEASGWEGKLKRLRARPVLTTDRKTPTVAHPARRTFAVAGALVSVLWAIPCSGPAWSAGTTDPPPNVQQLVQDAAHNQLVSIENPARHYRCRHQEITPQASQTNEEIVSSEGMVARLLKVNGHAPSKKQCRHSLGRLARIQSNGRFARSRFREQRQETDRRAQLFRALPRAFLFRYDATEPKQGLVRLTYRPNPSFHPPNRVAAVLAGLAGTMWIDPSSRHIVRIDGHVVTAVTFGWGILAKLYPGGNYVMVQTKLPDGDWELTRLEVTLHGSLFVFKKLDVNLKELYTAYSEVPKNLNLDDAIEILRRMKVNCGS